MRELGLRLKSAACPPLPNGTKNNKAPVTMPYSEIPEYGLEDPSELALWARDAFDAALRAKQVKAK